MKFYWLCFYFAFSVSLSVTGDPVWPPLPPRPVFPADNPQTESKVALGQALFFDPRISKTGTVSCLTCHNVMSSGENNLPSTTKPNGKQSRHSAPTVWNSAFMSSFFWMGTASSLEEQAEGPLEEMGLGDSQEVVRRIAAIPGYRSQFSAIFGGDDGTSVTLKNLTRALASYERTLITPQSPFDRYLAGNDKAMNDVQKNGFRTFQEIGCVECHFGPNFAGPSNTGRPFLKPFPRYADPQLEARYHLSDDRGLIEATGKASDRNVWRVPTLRNIELTAPYFHNGSVPTLAEAVKVMAKTQLNRTLTENEVNELASFLKTLTGEQPLQRLPRLPKLN